MIDMWLNIATAVGTIGAVVVSLFLSGKETRIRRANEINNNEIIKEIIHTSLNNSAEKLLEYKIMIEKAIASKNGTGVFFIYYHGAKTSEVSYEAGLIISEYLDKNMDIDLLFISTQLNVLKDMGVESISLKWVKIYYKAVSDLTLLEKTLEKMSSMRLDDSQKKFLLENVNVLLIPIEKSMKELQIL